MIKSIMKLFGGGDTSPSGQSKSKNSSNGEKDLENFVDYIVRALVDHPEEVRIKSEKAEEGEIIVIDCNKKDIGKIVGKRGKTIMAIRSLVSGAASRLQKRITVEVVD